MQKMRIFRGLENIHAVIERHEAEWRREQGEEPERPDAISLEEAVRRRLAAQPDAGSGRFAADRFLGGNTEPLKPEPEPETVPEIQQEAPEPEPEPEATSEPEAVEVIPQKDGRHSWLYNEVMKAVNDAAGDRKNTKIIAVFVPVVQNGDEFTELQADETLELSPVDSEAVKPEPATEAVEIIPHKDGRHSRLYDEVMKAINDAAEDGKASRIVAVFVPVIQGGAEFEDLPADETVTISAVSEDIAQVEVLPEAPEPEPVPEPEPETETLPEAVPEPEPEPEFIIEPEAQEEVPEIPTEDEDITTPEEPETEPELEALPEIEPDAPDEPEPEPEEATAPDDFDLMPEAVNEPDAELAEAFRVMDEKLDENLQEEQEQEEPSDAPEDLPDAPELEDVDFEDEAIPEGEPLKFEEIQEDTPEDEAVEPEEETPQELPPMPEIDMPGELDDDEVFDGAEFDETLTEVITPSGEEIEILPDPVK